MVFNVFGTGITDLMFDPSDISIPVTHTHSLVDGNVTDGDHTHAVIRTFYVINSTKDIYVSTDNGDTWLYFGKVPSAYGEYGVAFAFDGKVYVSVINEIISTTDGSSWETLDFTGNIHSSDFSYDNESVLLGGENEFWEFDGATFDKKYTFEGVVKPEVCINSVRKNFSYILNNEESSIDFKGVNTLGTNIDISPSFDKCYPINGKWSDGIKYNLYFNDRIISSTKNDFVNSFSVEPTIDNDGVIDFSKQSLLTKELNYGDTTKTVA
jgi:hypothetical protein